MRSIFSISLLTFAVSLPAFAAVDQGLLALAPPEARFIASIDISRAKNSQFGQYVLNRADTDNHDFEEMIRATGFDPRRDLQDVVLAASGPAADAAESHFAVIARGTFDGSRIRAAAQAKGGHAEMYHGVDLFTESSENRPTAFAFLGDGVAILGDVPTVRQIIANRDMHQTLNPTLETLISAIGPDNDVWFVSSMPGSYLADNFARNTNQQAARQALTSILQSSGGIQFGEMVRLSFDATARSPKDAQALADVIRFLGSMAQMAREKGPAGDILASAVDQMTLQTNGDMLHASLSMPEKSLEQLADIAPLGSQRHSLRQR